ncbi:enterotoxin A family protein [Morganella psychrotolerans]|uniref:Pertussis toxin subunit 1 n=1 Tax=Morganella psychrotolerans TaxID=368603 RepID=A0A1B8HDV2_9GAMM|nr:enterotoxin A family protein [Morganella psychrotolerans]OBU07247.1 hypothetical protein AYY17_04275 [Morganella psychrotolerans]
MIKKILILIGLISVSMSAVAIDKVYRADGRSPDEIFKSGLRSWGNNPNMIDHVSDVTAANGNRTTAFISTSTNINSAERFLDRGIRTSESGRFYIYHIRPSRNFYYISDLINTLYARENLTLNNYHRSLFGGEVEYSALRHIESTQIYGVTAYHINEQGQLVTEPFRVNPYYTHGNAEVYDSPIVPAEMDLPITNVQVHLTTVGVASDRRVVPTYQLPDQLIDNTRSLTLGCIDGLIHFISSK